MRDPIKRLKTQREWRLKNKKHCQDYQRNYRQKNIETIREYDRNNYQNHKEKHKEWNDNWRNSHKEQCRKFGRKQRMIKRLEIIQLLGGECVNPYGQHKEPYRDTRCLQVDHIHGGGVKEHRKLENPWSYLNRVKKSILNKEKK